MIGQIEPIRRKHTKKNVDSLGCLLVHSFDLVICYNLLAGIKEERERVRQIDQTSDDSKTKLSLVDKLVVWTLFFTHTQHIQTLIHAHRIEGDMEREKTNFLAEWYTKLLKFSNQNKVT